MGKIGGKIVNVVVGCPLTSRRSFNWWMQIAFELSMFYNKNCLVQLDIAKTKWAQLHPMTHPNDAPALHWIPRIILTIFASKFILIWWNLGHTLDYINALASLFFAEKTHTAVLPRHTLILGTPLPATPALKATMENTTFAQIGSLSCKYPS